MKKEKQKETDTEMLARLMLNGFDEIKGEMADMKNTMATKQELQEFREEVNTRFDIIENIRYRGHDNRIEKLEDKMLQVGVLLGKRLV
jgi:hypothetical protein